MTEQASEHNEKKRRFRWPWVVLVILILLVALLRLSLKTDYIRNIVKDRVVSAANDQLTVELSINRLKGDLWKEIVLEDITLKENDQDTVAGVDSLRLRYNLLSYFSSVLEVPKIAISGPYLKVRQQDGQLNLSHWVKSSPADTGTVASDPFFFRLESIQVDGGRIDAMIEAMPKDSAFTVENLQIRSSFALLEEGYEVEISEFAFDVIRSALDEKVSFESRLSANKQSISLQKLVLASGSSLIQSSGNFSLEDSSASLDVQAQPLSWRDIAAFVDQSAVEQNIGLDLKLKGRLDDFSVGLGVRSKGIDDLQISASFKRDTTFTLTGANISAERLNLMAFFNDSSMPDITRVDFSSEGAVPLTSVENGSIKGSLHTGSILYNSYRLDTLETDFSSDKGKLSATLATRRQQQRVTAKAGISDIWITDPQVNYAIRGSGINPGYWLQDEQFKGTISFNGTLKGSGLSLDDSSWDYRLDLSKGRVYEQEYSEAVLSGKINPQRITGNSRIKLSESEVSLNAVLTNYRATPAFTYELSSRGFDLSEIVFLNDFKTSLNLDVKGEGSGSDLANLSINSAIAIDSSVVNGERIDQLHANLQLENSIATVTEAGMQSTIAEVIFGARLNLNDWYDTANRLDLDLVLKDLQSVAPLVGAENLQAEGSVTGKLVPAESRELQFSGNVDLGNLQLDDLFASEGANGNIEILLKQEPEYTADLFLDSPRFSTVRLQDLVMNTGGRVVEDVTDGTFSLKFVGPEQSELIHAGGYHISPDSIKILTNRLDVVSSVNTLSLQQPFDVSIVANTVRMDTLRLSSADGTSLELAVPYADSLRQRGYLRGNNINLSVLQNTLLGESYFDGMLTGKVSVANSDTSLKALGNLSVSEVSYRGVPMDSVTLELDLEEEQLKSFISVRDQGDELLSGRLNVPFRLGDPQEFDESFFEHQIDGSLRVKRVALNRFRNLLNEMGMRDTDGILHVEADLSGTAGIPEFKARFSLDSASVSGVKIDSITANLDYSHQLSSVRMNATVNSLKQKVAEIKGQVPFNIDLRQGEISPPGEEDSIRVDIVTNDFNLSAVNDFVDREVIRNIRGKLNGRIQATGTPADLLTDGTLKISEGAMRIVETGITVDNITTGIVFEPDLITVTDFTARSGSGSLTMNGSVALEELIPGDLNLSMRARNFRVANTSEYNASIDLDTKLTGSMTRPNVSGKLTILNGFVQLDNFGEKSVEDVQLDSTEQSDNNVALYDSLSIDMDIAFNRRFYIRNQRYLEMEVELDGAVDMLKDAGSDLQMFGSLEAVNGYARPLGKRFELEEGIITFSGNPTNPNLNIRTIFEPVQPEEEVKIWYIIEGNVEDPQFKYESSPPMELEDILCYTLFGQPCFALESWKQALASTGSNAGATGLALELFSDRIETLASQSLGIDVVKIENTTVGGESGTSITTGWYINPKVFFAIQNIISGSSPETSFLLEYMLLENLKLIISQGNDARQGVDIKWNYDY
ncbi:AsmA family protein [Balneolaceae bacterium YR4-1]|uniref:AsmA family protein n=1 Tax=Halalkalibaculum roseum TaxID=2709311 RepID=A0A6M1STW9_9BACT|nr:translocation/assembly module TamB [Halalkalibaculum roseum]NGP75548.1 AsmA family protein [Halalkalibaculum roseum]